MLRGREKHKKAQKMSPSLHWLEQVDRNLTTDRGQGAYPDSSTNNQITGKGTKATHFFSLAWVLLI